MIKVKLAAQNERIRDMFLRKIKRPANTAAAKAAETLAEIVRANIKGGYESVLGGGGKWYPISEDYFEQVGYSPGQWREEDLLNSVEVKDMGNGAFGVVVNDEKAVWLEYGGFAVRKDIGLVPPRPFFRTAVHYFKHNHVANNILMEEVEGVAD